MELANIPKDFSSRYLNDGFSGGEKKRMELLQLALLRPEIAVLDETDSGLDIDALRTVAEGVNKFAGPDMGVLIITHYQRILHMVKPDFVHVMFEGRIVKEGGPELVGVLEEKGYGWIREEVEAAAARLASARMEPRRPPAPDRGLPRSRRSAPPSRRSSARSTGSRSPTSTAAPARSGCWPRSRRSTATSARHHSNVHRGSHTLSAEATAAYEGARATVADHLGAADRREVIFVRNATEAINLVARAWGDANVGAGDRIVLTEMEHHSNIVPWQQLAERVGRRDRLGAGRRRRPARHGRPRGGCSSAGRSWSPSPTSPTCSGPRTRSPRSPGWPTRPARWSLADGAQAAPKLPLDVAELGVDFYAITGHKLYGADRDRRALGRLELLRADAALPRRRLDDPQGDQGGHHLRRPAGPLRGGHAGDRPGDRDGLGAALARRARDGGGARRTSAQIADYALERLAEVPGPAGLRPAARRRSALGPVSFELEGVHAHDVSEILDRHGVAVRAGHHCAQLLMDRLGVAATARASFGVYTTREEIDRLVEGLDDARKVFGL